jgi:hypothetical protein
MHFAIFHAMLASAGKDSVTEGYRSIAYYPSPIKMLLIGLSHGIFGVGSTKTK